jgi:hypothetical protein
MIDKKFKKMIEENILYKDIILLPKCPKDSEQVLKLSIDFTIVWL